MKPHRKNNDRSGIAVTNISRHGIWLLSTDKELFIPFNEFPRFRDASVVNIFHVEQPTPNMLHWPRLGMTVALESLRRFTLAASTSESPTRSTRRIQVTPVTQSKTTVRTASRRNSRTNTKHDGSKGSTRS